MNQSRDLGLSYLNSKASCYSSLVVTKEENAKKIIFKDSILKSCCFNCYYILGRIYQEWVAEIIRKKQEYQLTIENMKEHLIQLILQHNQFFQINLENLTWIDFQDLCLIGLIQISYCLKGFHLGCISFTNRGQGEHCFINRRATLEWKQQERYRLCY